MILSMLVLAAPSAFGQQTCTEPMSRIQLGASIGDVADALRISELVDAREALDRIHDRLPCLEEVVDPKLFASFARYNALVYYYGQEEDQALSWGLAAERAQPDVWDEALFPAGHPVRVLIDAATPPDPQALGGKGLAPPPGGGLFVNGAFVARPEAPPELPGLVQVFDRGQRRLDGKWIVGNAFPDAWMSDKVVDASPPSWLGKTVAGGGGGGGDKPPRPPRANPFPTVPVLAAVGLAAVSGAAYFGADRTAAGIDGAAPADLTGLRTRANLLVLTSGATLAGAVGVGIGGFVVSGRF